MSSRTKSSTTKLSEPLLKNAKARIKLALSEASRAIKTASEATGVPVSEIDGTTRRDRASFARQLAYLLANSRPNMTQEIVGIGFGKERTTIREGLKAIAAARETDPKLRLMIERAETIASRENRART